MALYLFLVRVCEILCSGCLKDEAQMTFMNVVCVGTCSDVRFSIPHWYQMFLVTEMLNLWDIYVPFLAVFQCNYVFNPPVNLQCHIIVILAATFALLFEVLSVGVLI